MLQPYQFKYSKIHRVHSFVNYVMLQVMLKAKTQAAADFDSSSQEFVIHTTMIRQAAGVDRLIILTTKKILIVDYKRNVNSEEVDKFLRDLDFNNSSGIILSQQSGICNKKDWFIEIKNSNVIVYVHNVNYDSKKIQMAVDIIDHLAFSLSMTHNDSIDSVVISPELLTMLNFEYSNFCSSRDSIIQLSKNFQKDLMNQLKKLEIPSLISFLARKSLEPIIKCKFCDFTTTKKNSLNAHMSKHKKIQDEKSDDTSE